MIHKQYLRDEEELIVTFVLCGAYWQSPIAVVGDFNDWDPSANLLSTKDGHTATTTLKLKAGRRYEFRYVDSVGNWYTDGFADGFNLTSYNSYNAVLQT